MSYFEITQQSFETVLSELGKWELLKDPKAKENIYLLDNNIKIYSSIVGGFSRGVAEDAIRVVVWCSTSNLPVKSSEARVYRIDTWAKNLRERILKVKTDIQTMKKCKICGAFCVERVNSTTKEKFWGCLNYKNHNKSKNEVSKIINTNNTLESNVHQNTKQHTIPTCIDTNVSACNSPSNFEPNKYQKAIFKFIQESKRHGIIKAGAGTAKCLGKDTLVMMYDGMFKKVQDVLPMDALMGMDSQPRFVKTISSGIGKLYKIIPLKGEPWVCNEDHILTLINSVTNEIFDMSVSTFLKQHNHKCSDAKLFRVPIDFPTQKTELPPYLLGIWLGDGTKASPSITTPENEIIEYCKQVAPQYGSEVVLRKDPGCYDVRFRMGIRGVGGRNTPHLIFRLFKKSINNSGEKYIPYEYLCNNTAKRLELLAGIVDTDGYVNRKQITIVTKYKSLANDILFLARSLGFSAYCSITKGIIKSINFIGSYYRITINGETSVIPCKVPRKKSEKRLQKKNVLRTGFKIENIGIGEYYGFTLDGDGHFLLGDFTVTHNTTTIVMGTKYIPSSHSVLFMAFNKHIVKELASKLPPHADVRTTHSLGLLNVRNAFGDIEVDEYKQKNILWDLMNNSNYKEDDRYEIVSVAGRLCSLVKANLLEITEENIEYLMDYHGIISPISLSETASIINMAIKISITNKRVIDYDDMIYYPLKFNLPCKQYDFVMMDEAQDMTRSQLELALKSVKPKGRIIAVGDESQSCYGFRGAATDAMQNMAKRLQATELPLSVTYRCPASHVRLANKFVPELESRPNAPEGTIKCIDYNEFFDIVKPGDMVICRNNSSLIRPAFVLLGRGIKVAIKGRDIGENLVNIVKKFNAIDIKSFHTQLDEWRSGELKRCKKKGTSPGMVEDKYEVLNILSENCNDIRCIINKIKTIFSDENTAITFSSVHRAKGLESQVVHILEPSLMPSKHVTQDWEKTQEKNIMYIAVTRSKDKLFFVSGDGNEGIFSEYNFED